MAWNEPGGNGNNQDPWSGGGNRGGGNRGGDGPPDLDEALRKLQEKMNGIFGGGGSGSGSRSGKGSSLGTGGILLLIVGLLVALGRDGLLHRQRAGASGYSATG